MRDAIEFDNKNTDIRGDVTVQLRDAKTGELVHEQKGHNFIGQGILGYFLRKASHELLFQSTMAQCGGDKEIIMSPTNPIGLDLFPILKLTSDSAEEDPATEYNTHGSLAGWAETAVNDINTGDARKGIFNLAESYATGNKLHFVFDFAADRANDEEFRSVSFTRFPRRYPYESRVRRVYRGTFPRVYAFLTYDSNLIWGISQDLTKLYKIDPITYEEIESVTIPAITTLYSFCMKGNIAFIAHDSTVSVLDFTSPETLIGTVDVGQSNSLQRNALVNGGDGYIYGFPYTSGAIRINEGDFDGNYLSLLTVAKFNEANLTRTLIDIQIPQIQSPNTGRIVGMAGFSYGYNRNGVMVLTARTKIDFPSGQEFQGIYGYQNVLFTPSTVMVEQEKRCHLTDGCIGNYWDGSGLYSFVQESKYNLVSEIAEPISSLYKTDHVGENYNLMTRKLLDAAVTKRSTQTMKIVYDITIGDW